MEEIPSQLVEGLSIADGRAVAIWWTALDRAAQVEVVALWDGQQDECFFGASRDAPGAPAPVVIGGRFVPHDDAWGLSEWGPSYFEHLLNHPELVILDQPETRTFHICTAHEAARAVLAEGRVPAQFTCPLGSLSCPMRRLLDLAPNHSLHLIPAASRPGGIER